MPYVFLIKNCVATLKCASENLHVVDSGHVQNQCRTNAPKHRYITLALRRITCNFHNTTYSRKQKNKSSKSVFFIATQLLFYREYALMTPNRFPIAFPTMSNHVMCTMPSCSDDCDCTVREDASASESLRSHYASNALARVHIHCGAAL